MGIKWLITFNPNKTESVRFSRKINKPVHPPLYMNHQLINKVTNHEHSGFNWLNDLSWHEHPDYIKTKSLEPYQCYAQTKVPTRQKFTSGNI